MTFASECSRLTSLVISSADTISTVPRGAGVVNFLNVKSCVSSVGSITCNGFVLADMMPRMFGILGSATPSAQLATSGVGVFTTSFTLNGCCRSVKIKFFNDRNGWNI